MSLNLNLNANVSSEIFEHVIWRSITREVIMWVLIPINDVLQLVFDKRYMNIHDSYTLVVKYGHVDHLK